jgi:hypothetical protein
MTGVEGWGHDSMNSMHCHNPSMNITGSMTIVRATLPLRPQTERGKRLINHTPIAVGILSKQQYTAAMHRLAPIAVGILRDQNW